MNARRLSVRTKIPGGIYHLGCVAFFRSEPQPLAVFTNLDARRFSVGTKIPGGIFQFNCGALFGQNRNSWQHSPVRKRCVFRPAPKFPAVYPNLHARSGPKVPGDSYHFEFEAFLSQNRDSGRRLPICARGVFRSEPKFLAVLPSLIAWRYSVRTETPGSIYQLKCEVLVGQNLNSWQHLPV